MKHLTFAELGDEQWLDRQVQLRGFVYSSSKGECYLANEPHLRHCCVGARDKALQQVYIAGLDQQKISNREVVTLQGLLHKETFEDGSARYALSEVVLLPEKTLPYITLSLAVLLFIIFSFLVWYFQAKPRK